ncbi:MAG: glycosyltransferase [Deltaproteobacteria bacterium]|nr:glycosyltransferase [Deltaproteobacteria bacterium]
MLHDRDSLLTLVNDKLNVRNYVKAKVGDGCLVPLLWLGEDAESIPFARLPSKFVIKATHGGGYNVFVKDKKELDQRELVLRVKRFLKKNYCLDRGIGIEWGYKNINPRIIVEPFIEEKGNYPVDYKFYCFSGQVEFVVIHFDRFTGHKTKTFDRDFKPHEFRYQHPIWQGKFQRPRNFEAMVSLAESLAKSLNFIRVDLYSVGGKIYFSELTPYPGGTTTKFLPERQDIILGRRWGNKVFPIQQSLSGMPNGKH